MEATFNFSGKTALVIGGTTGIGRATALAFAEAGANQYIAGLGESEGKGLVAEIGERFPKVQAEFAELDVRDAAAMKAFHDQAFKRFGRVEIAFNNAGVPGKTAPIQDLDEADFYKIIDTNLKGVFLGLKYQVPHMIEKGGGAI